MTSRQTEIAQDDFRAGFVRDVPQHLIDPSGAYDLVNILLSQGGGPFRRGGTEYKSNAGLGSTGLRWGWDGYLIPGQRTVVANKDDFGVLASDDATPINLGGAGLALPKQAAALGDVLFIGGVALYGGSRKTAPYSTGTITLTNGSKTVTGAGTIWNTLVDSGMLLQRGDERVYPVASIDSTTQITLRDAYQGANGAGISYSLNPLYTVTGPDPYGTEDFVAVCANRLVVASGSTVRFTPIDNPHVFNPNDFHTLPEGVQILGLAVAGQVVLIFTTAGIWRLLGLASDIVDANGNPLHRLEAWARDVVLFSAPGIASDGQTLVVPATNGVYIVDGISAPQKITQWEIDTYYMRWVEAGYRAGQAATFQGHYFLPIIDSAGQVLDLLVCRISPPTWIRLGGGRRWFEVFPWTRFDGDGGEITAFVTRNASGGAPNPQLLGMQARSPSRVVKCNSYFEPDAGHKLDADGSCHLFDIITRDFETGNLTKNVVRRVRLLYDLFDAASDNPMLAISYSDGSIPAGAPLWDDVTWDDFLWAGDDEGASFVHLGDLPESDGIDPHRIRVNKALRYVRFRIQQQRPAAALALRNFEMFVRPAGSRRR